MPEESVTPDLVELTRRVTEAGNARDVEEMIKFYAPESVWDMSSVGLGIFEGRAAVRGVFEDWFGAYEDYEQEAEEIRDLGNGVTFGIFVMRGRSPGSTGWVEQRYAAVSTWSGGLIQRTTNSFDVDETRAAAERLAQERAEGMSQENVEVVKRLMDAVHRRDIDAFARVTTPDFEWFPVFAARVEGDVYRGREGIEAFLGEVDEIWEEFRPVPEEYRDLGDRVLGLGRLRTRGRGSGVPIDAPWGGVYDVRDGKVSRIRTYLDHGEALRAAGLPE